LGLTGFFPVNLFIETEAFISLLAVATFTSINQGDKKLETMMAD
jgi:hypothetical protein